MQKFYLYALVCLGSLSAPCFAQDLHSHLHQMQTAYAASGSIVVLSDQTLVIEPNMPGPLCALPKIEGGRTTWSFYTFPLASITVPLADVDETLMSEDRVFTDPGATKAYKPGDVGDTTMIVVVGVPGKQFHVLAYDRERLASLGPGPHNSADYGQAPDDVMAFGLTFADQTAAHAFREALRDAVIFAKTQTVAKAQTGAQTGR
jgi:hypothetical protein